MYDRGVPIPIHWLNAYDPFEVVDRGSETQLEMGEHLIR